MAYKPGVRDQHPLKQGLRPPETTKDNGQSGLVRDQHPLKQGLRRNRHNPEWSSRHRVRDQHPLKQGLRPGEPHIFPRTIVVESETNIH